MPGRFRFPAAASRRTTRTRIAAALRETEEEVGLPRDRVSVVGRLDTYLTGTGFEITPVVGIVAPPSRCDRPVRGRRGVRGAAVLHPRPRNHQRVERQSGAHRRAFFVCRTRAATSGAPPPASWSIWPRCWQSRRSHAPRPLDDRAAAAAADRDLSRLARLTSRWWTAVLRWARPAAVALAGTGRRGIAGAGPGYVSVHFGEPALRPYVPPR